MLKKVIRRLVRLYKIFILKDKFLLAHKKWVKDNGDETLRLDYKLTKNSVVFDIGGYRGDFAESIYEKYNCTVYVFEPVQEYFEFIKKRFDEKTINILVRDMNFSTIKKPIANINIETLYTQINCDNVSKVIKELLGG